MLPLLNDGDDGGELIARTPHAVFRTNPEELARE
jgi:hypothetical protein